MLLHWSLYLPCHLAIVADTISRKEVPQSSSLEPRIKSQNFPKATVSLQLETSSKSRFLIAFISSPESFSIRNASFFKER